MVLSCLILLPLQILFYCHFPDLLLAHRRSRAHSAYRAPLDYAEQTTTGMADRLLVNSHYTQGLSPTTTCDLHLGTYLVHMPPPHLHDAQHFAPCM